MTWIILGVAQAIMPFILGLVLLIRNTATYQYHLALVSRIDSLCGQAILDGDYSSRGHERYAILDSVSYTRMMLTFWRRFDYWFQGEDFNVKRGWL